MYYHHIKITLVCLLVLSPAGTLYAHDTYVCTEQIDVPQEQTYHRHYHRRLVEYPGPETLVERLRKDFAFFIKLCNGTLYRDPLAAQALQLALSTVLFP